MYNQTETYLLMRKFYELGINEKRIIDYLMDNGGNVKITYSELTEELELDKKKLCPNIRKAVLHLEKLKLVCVVKKHKEEEYKVNPMESLFLVEGWMDNLLRAEI